MPQDPLPTKPTVLISGEGSNLQALIDAAPLMPHLTIVRVISNKAGANGLNRAKAASIPTGYHNLVSGNAMLPEERTQL
jgi:phosphoribosylglycinamide formyltransferase